MSNEIHTISFNFSSDSPPLPVVPQITIGTTGEAPSQGSSVSPFYSAFSGFGLGRLGKGTTLQVSRRSRVKTFVGTQMSLPSVTMIGNATPRNVIQMPEYQQVQAAMIGRPQSRLAGVYYRNISHTSSDPFTPNRYSRTRRLFEHGHAGPWSNTSTRTRDRVYTTEDLEIGRNSRLGNPPTTGRVGLQVPSQVTSLVPSQVPSYTRTRSNVQEMVLRYMKQGKGTTVSSKEFEQLNRQMAEKRLREEFMGETIFGSIEVPRRTGETGSTFRREADELELLGTKARRKL